MESRFVLLEGIGPVGDQHMEVNICVQRGAEALYEGHDPGLSPSAAARARSFEHRGAQRPGDHVQHPCQDVRTRGKKHPQRPWKG